MTRKFAPPPTKFGGSSAQSKPQTVTKGAAVPPPPTRFGAVSLVQAKRQPDRAAPAGGGRVVQAMMFGQNFQEEQASPAELMAVFGERIRFSAAMSDFLVSEFPPDDAFAEPEEMEGIDEEPVYQQAPQFDFSNLFLQQKKAPGWQNCAIQMAAKKKKVAKKHVGVTDKTYVPGKKFIDSPSSKKTYLVHQYDGRDFYYKKDATNRVTEMHGTLRHVIAKRQKTGKVKNKRKNDHSSHLIAHSLGGDPKFTDNYVSMKDSINSHGGEWHQMEHYVRERLKKANSKAYMACVLEYNGTAKGRPSRIRVSVYFNRIPYKVDFTINTP